MPLKVAVDVQYDDPAGVARAAAVVFEDWGDAAARDVLVRDHAGLHPYVAGEFYRRELPVLLPLLDRVFDTHPIDTVIIDGFVDLGPSRPGLGRHLFDALGARPRVVGVAKTEFAGALARPLLRGDSTRPLFVSATDNLPEAVAGVGEMDGSYRLPTLLKLVDRKARGD